MWKTTLTVAMVIAALGVGSSVTPLAGRRLDHGVALAQTGPAPRSSTRRPPIAPRRPSRAAASSPAGTSPAGAPSRGGSPTTTSPAAAETDAGAAEEPDLPMGQRIVAFIKTYATWILLVLGIALISVIAWFLLGSRREGDMGDFLESLDGGPQEDATSQARRYSSTKISASDVNARLGGTVKGTEVETDQEYALVVDESALKMPPLPEELDSHTGRTYSDDEEIRALMAQDRFDQAYDVYLRQIEEDGSAEFRAEVEIALSEYFIRQKDLGRAARILEHHEATHAPEDVSPETYFNLGYIHVLTGTFNKSRRFLRKFVNSRAKPEHVKRARTILARIENLN